MRRRRLRRVAAFAVLSGFAGLWAAFAEGTTDIVVVDKIGWWTRRPGAQPLNNPSTFEVAAGVQGDESVAALRILIRGTVTKASLVMGEADAPLSNVNKGKLRVCTTTSPWLVADGGAYTNAPKPDCNGAVELKRAVDASGAGSWSGDITSMLVGARSEISLMVVPSPDASAVVPPTYYIKLNARIAAEGQPDVQPTTTVPPVTSPSLPADTGAVTPHVVASSPPVTSPVTTAPPTTVASMPDTNTVPPRLTIANEKERKEWSKLFLLVPLSAFAAALYTGGRKIVERGGITPAMLIVSRRTGS